MIQDAVSDFLFLSDLSYDYGLIDRTCYWERMVTLYDLLEVDEKIINNILPPYGREYYNFLLEEQIKEEAITLENTENIGQIHSKGDPNNSLLQLYRTNQKGKQCFWEFYERDRDPHPSVPHGHGIQLTALRLDPFRRKMFERMNGLNYFGLEDKKFIKALWNDNNFRGYALNAIKDFINSGIVGKNYNWSSTRGISNPYRLPKKKP